MKNFFKSTRAESIYVGNSVKSSFQVSLFINGVMFFDDFSYIQYTKMSFKGSFQSSLGLWPNADIKCNVIRHQTCLISQQKLCGLSVSFSKPHQVARVEDIQMSSVASN